MPKIRYLITLKIESSIISIDSNITDNIICKVINQSVSQKISISAIRHKLGISELWSRGVWEPTLKGPNGIRGKAPENVGYLTLIRL